MFGFYKVSKSLLLNDNKWDKVSRVDQEKFVEDNL